MAELIIGHTSHDSARLWIRGSRRQTAARVIVKPQPFGEPSFSPTVRLERADDYTAVVPVALEPGVHYRVVVEFARTGSGLGRPSEVCCGELRALPDPARDDPPFEFLLGSCNLPTARITRVGALAASGLGTVALGRSARRPSSSWIWPRPERLRWKIVWAAMRTVPWAVQLVLSRAPWLLWGATMQLTRFRQPEPLLASPFGPLLGLVEQPIERRPAFMIHAGDQMYFDTDVPTRSPDVEEYRRAYREAWFEDETARAFLASCTQYMILDDHEIADEFANQERLADHARPALRAYREYVHTRHPGGDAERWDDGERDRDEEPYYYAFRHGSVRFFVLDVRTRRSIEARKMIDDDQMAALQRWMKEHRKALKFVVSSVPFVGQLRSRDDEGNASVDPQDKWCGELFRAQRDEIIDHVYEEAVERLTFLVGDMHCTYHATLRVGRPDRRFVIHELAAGPINQVQFTPRSAFRDHYRAHTGGGLPYSCVMRSFQGATATALRVRVDPEADAVRWTCVPTRRPRGDRYQPPPMSGHIRFPEPVS